MDNRRAAHLFKGVLSRQDATPAGKQSAHFYQLINIVILDFTECQLQAAKAGNLGACCAIASFVDNLGLREEGMKYRRRAARLGDLHSQVPDVKRRRVNSACMNV